MKPLFHAFFISLGLILFFSCKKTATTPLSAAKEIDSFSVRKADGSAFAASDIQVVARNGSGADSIVVTIPAYTDKTKLTPFFVLKGKSVTPASGSTLDFSAPVVFTVTAEDGSQLKYTVVLKCRGAVFFGTNDNRFFAVDAGTGNPVWKDSVPGMYETYVAGFEYNRPQLVNGLVYAASNSGTIFGFDPSTGTIKSQYKPGGPLATTPAMVNGTMYLGSDDHNFYAVDLATGGTKWSFPTAFPTDSDPVVVNGTVYFGADFLYALDSASGTLKWRYNLNGYATFGSPVVYNGMVYIGSLNDTLYALDAMTGSLRWRAKTDGQLDVSTPAISNGVLYVGAESGSLYAFDPATGAQLWKSLTGASVYDQPFIYNNTLFETADDGHLYAVNAQTGAPLWNISQFYANGGGAIVANGVLYAGAGGSHYFYAVDPASGNVLWRFPTGNNSLVLSRQALYIPGN
jgi:outer membrane protein assembly factor BamB